MIKHPKATINQFIKYFLDFYGDNGIYPIGNISKEQIKLGIKLRGEFFEGDSMDREAIRDIILTARNQLGGMARI